MGSKGRSGTGSNSSEDDIITAKPIVIVALYIAQTGFFNATQPLMKSILMDYVPKKTRGRWSSVDSVTSFGWSGSAVIGGFLISSYSYRIVFWVTGLCMFIS